MAILRGKAEVRSYINGLPGAINKLLLGGARAGAKVIAEEAKDRSISSEVRDAIKVAAQVQDGRVVGKVQVKGPGAYIAPWLEYGTRPHLISVDDSQRRGMSIRTINRRANDQGGNHSLVIGGNFVGSTVMHPGARPHPFLRPALDIKEGEALAAAQSYINARIKPSGIVGGEDGGS